MLKFLFRLLIAREIFLPFEYARENITCTRFAFAVKYTMKLETRDY